MDELDKSITHFARMVEISETRPSKAHYQQIHDHLLELSYYREGYSTKQIKEFFKDIIKKRSKRQ